MLMGSIAHRGTPFSNYSDTGGPTLAREITADSQDLTTRLSAELKKVSFYAAD
jgi:hypothetical protein